MSDKPTPTGDTMEPLFRIDCPNCRDSTQQSNQQDGGPVGRFLHAEPQEDCDACQSGDSSCDLIVCTECGAEAATVHSRVQSENNETTTDIGGAV